MRQFSILKIIYFLFTLYTGWFTGYER